MKASPSTVPPMTHSVDHLQAQLGHQFRQRSLLERALTHRSFSADHYERLEFLGDSVLNLAVSDLLWHRHHNWTEGELSRVRAQWVKQDTLAGLARLLSLPQYLRLGEGELRSGGRQRPSIQADALEAVLGAIYLDAGYDTVAKVVQRLYAHMTSSPMEVLPLASIGKDPKTSLQEWLQGRKLPLPNYQVVHISGAAHEQVFDVACSVAVPHQAPVHGQGTSRRAAEQAAAEVMLAQLSLSN